MKYLILDLGIFFLLIVQAGIFSRLGFFGYANLLLVFMAVAVIFSGFNKGLAISLFTGIMFDFLSSQVFGFWSFVFVSVFLIAFFALRFFVPKEPNKLIIFSTVAGVTLLYYLVVYFYSKVFGIFHLSSSFDVVLFSTKIIPFSFLLNLLAVWPILQYFLFLNRWFQEKNAQPIRA